MVLLVWVSGERRQRREMSERQRWERERKDRGEGGEEDNRERKICCCRSECQMERRERKVITFHYIMFLSYFFWLLPFVPPLFLSLLFFSLIRFIQKWGVDESKLAKKEGEEPSSLSTSVSRYVYVCGVCTCLCVMCSCCLCGVV